ncbi:hypothetical protein ACFX11_012364 [Malus domestica]
MHFRLCLYGIQCKAEAIRQSANNQNKEIKTSNLFCCKDGNSNVAFNASLQILVSGAYGIDRRTERWSWDFRLHLDGSVTCGNEQGRNEEDGGRRQQAGEVVLGIMGVGLLGRRWFQIVERYEKGGRERVERWRGIWVWVVSGWFWVWGRRGAEAVGVKDRIGEEWG